MLQLGFRPGKNGVEDKKDRNSRSSGNRWLDAPLPRGRFWGGVWWWRGRMVILNAFFGVYAGNRPGNDHISDIPISWHFWSRMIWKGFPVWWDMLVSWRVLSLKSVRLHQIYLKHHKYHQLLINRIPDEHATNQWHLSAPKKYRTRFLGLKTIELRNWHPWNWNQELKKIIVKKKHVFWWSFLLGAVWNW